MKKYRVVENLFRNKMVDEDGPGSLQNIAADHTTSILWEKESEKEITPDTLSPVRINTEGYMGSVDINYELQVFDEEKKEWDFVGFLREKYQDQDEDEDCD